MQAYSKEFRREVLAACDAGGRTRAVAEQFGVSEAWVRRIKQERRETGKSAPATTRRRTSKWAAEADRIRAAPDLTLDELKARLQTSLSRTTLCRALQQLKLTLKKVLRASEQQRPDVAARRSQWRVWQCGLDPARLVFLDETWVTTNTTRPRGRAPKGERLLSDVPHGHWKTTTFLAALRVTGLTAPLVVDGAINGALFKGWVEQHLVLTLRSGDLVVMDNLASHKVAGVRQAIEQVGAHAVYLPPYSPDLNPIETVFSKFKWAVRSQSRRTIDALWTLCGQVSQLFDEPECRNHFQPCGYRYS
jgi:transposase